MKGKNKKHYVYGLYKKNIEYKTNRLDENLFYIGITSGGNSQLKTRAHGHRTEGHNSLKINIIKKYDFEIKVLYTCKDRKEAEEREAFLIRWFGKVDNGGILSNILDSAYDDGYIKIINRYNSLLESKIKNRDRRLSVPYEKIIEYINEWLKNPLETHSDFSKRNGIPVTSFSRWIRLYKPEYAKIKSELMLNTVELAVKSCNDVKGIIEFISSYTGMDYSVCKSYYQHHKHKLNIKKNNMPKTKRTEEYKVKWVYKRLTSNLSKREFSRQNNVNRERLDYWTNEYQGKTYTYKPGIVAAYTPYDWVFNRVLKSNQ